MKTSRTLVLMACLVGLLVAFAPTAKASYLDQKTVVTIRGEPIELPGGVVLQPGKYTMKVFGYPWSPNIVRVTNVDETKVYATMRVNSAQRMKATGETVLTLHEAPAGEPRPLCLWFYPGRRIGWEFHPMT